MVRVWNAKNGEEYALIREPISNVETVCWSPDSSCLAIGYASGIIQLWDVSMDSLLLRYRGHGDAVHSLSWSPDAHYLVSGGADHLAHVWERASGRLVLTYQGHDEPITVVAWSPDGKLIASGSYDRTVQIWEPLTGRLVTRYEGHLDSGGVLALAWSPDSQSLVSSAYGDGQLSVWTAEHAEQLCTYQGHVGHVRAVAWSPHASLIASGGDDTTVQVWDAIGCRKRSIYTGAIPGEKYWEADRNRYAVYAVAWSPAGKRIASGGWSLTPEKHEGIVHVWVVEA